MKNLKPLSILTRITFVGLIWSIFFLEGIRVIMLINWRFDIINPAHWTYAWNLWYNGTWVIDDSKEWAFILIIVSFIPLWLTGWAALSLIAWENVFMKMAYFPLHLFNKIFYKQVRTIKTKVSMKSVQKKKSYKEVRPRSIHGSVTPYSSTQESAPITPSLAKTNAIPRAAKPAPSARAGAPKVSVVATPAQPKEFDHSLFKFDDEIEDFEFNIDTFDVDNKKTEPTPPPSKKEDNRRDNKRDDNRRDNRDNKRDDNRRDNRDNKRDDNRKDNKQQNQSQNQSQNQAPKQGSGNSTHDVLKQKGYEVISGATIKNNLIDFIGVSQNQICLCLTDKEPGDWLADEERFNDEEPLWFSESSHRISPVRKIDITRRFLKEKLEENEFSFEIKAFVIEQVGNIINAEDMFETWNDMDIYVTRIDRGSPKELKLFSKSVDEAEGSINKDKFETIKKLIRSIS